MDRNQIKKVPWAIWEALAIFFLFLLLTWFSPSILAFFEGIGEEFSISLGLIELFLILSIFQLLIFFAWIGFIVKFKHKSDFAFLMERKFSFAELIQKGLASSLILFVTTMAASLAIFMYFPIDTDPQLVNDIFGLAISPKEKIIIFIAAVIIAPLTEEVYFRGFLYRALRNRYSQGMAISISSVIFSALHFDFYRFVPLFIAGVILNHIYDRYQNIILPIIAHGVWNAIMILTLFSTMGS